ncbi:MAG TPA: divalent metal cation transporter [Ktedonobacteraceae bacterium]
MINPFRKRTRKAQPAASRRRGTRVARSARASAQPRASVLKRVLKVIGPGVITGFADDDESGIGTYSQTGAQYGFKLLWTALAMLPLMYVVQEMAARIGLIIPLDWRQVLLATFVPHIELNFNYMFLLVGVLGTTISPYMIFWEPDEEIEEEIAAKMLPEDGGTPVLTKGYIGKMKFDTFLGMLCSEIITFFIIVTTAATLNAHGITNIQAPTQAALALEPLVNSFPHAGLLAKVLFSIGIIGTGFLAVPIFAGSSSYAIAETFGFKEGLFRTFPQAKIFYLIIIASTIVGVLLNFLGINPFSALIYTAVLNGIVAVPLIGMILLIATNKKIMGN